MQRRCFHSHLHSSSVPLSTDLDQANQVRCFHEFRHTERERFSWLQESATSSSPNMMVTEHHLCTRVTESLIEVRSNQPVSNNFEEEERAFHAYFSKAVSALLQNFIVQFPYRHVIQWSMQVGDRCEHDLYIDVRPPVPMDEN